MKELHNRCKQPIEFNNVSKGYYAQCPNCDEDLYEFETEKAAQN
jgi:uncharacterized protein YcgL (UPF0745 family)